MGSVVMVVETERKERGKKGDERGDGSLKKWELQDGRCRPRSRKNG